MFWLDQAMMLSIKDPGIAISGVLRALMLCPLALLDLIPVAYGKHRDSDGYLPRLEEIDMAV